MNTLILNHADVERLLTMEECIDVMVPALVALARGSVHLPQRVVVKPAAAQGLLGLMPVYMAGDEPAFGLKAVCVFPGNAARGKDIHQGSVTLFSAETGEIQALMNASAITATRTAAVSGLATRVLAREDAQILAIIGAGVQGWAHLEAMACVRPLTEVRVADFDSERARRFAQTAAQSHPFPVRAVATPEEAVRGADIIVTVTTSSEPVVRWEWVKAGAHINAVGSCTPQAREIDGATMAGASLFVDRREATFAEAGDYLLAATEGLVGPESIRGELGEVLTGFADGRTSEEEVTLFEALGLAVEDLACAAFLYRKAVAAGVGTWVEF